MAELKLDYDGKVFRFLHPDELDHIFSIMRTTGAFYEEELLSALRPFLKRDDWVVDVGANIGNHAIYFAGICGCNVIAFEPNPKTADLLRRNIELNNLQDRIQVHQVALGAGEGTGEIVAPGQHNLGMASVRVTEGRSGSTRIHPLSKYLGEQTVRLLKIDTEGMDYSVLMGAESIIERDKCVVSIEASDRQSFLKIAGLLERHDYTPVGSFNYTPTHIFTQDDGISVRKTLARMARQASLDYIDQSTLRAVVNRIRTETSSRLGELPGALAQHIADLPGAALQAQADHETRDYVRKEIGGLAERLDVFAVRGGEMEERLGGKVKTLLDSGAEGARQDSAHVISAIGDLQAKLTDVEAVALEASRRGAQACDSLEAINDAVRTLEKRIEHNTEAVLERHDLLHEVALRLAEAAARADSRIVDIAGGLAGLDRKTESLRQVGETSMKLLLGRVEALNRAVSLLGEEDSRKGASLTEVTRAVSGLGGEMARIGETAKASADEMLSAMSAWKENFDAMFRSAVLWAETENLRDVAWHQDQVLLKKDIDALRRLVVAEGEQPGPAALAEDARPVPSSAVPPESEGETRLAPKSGSVWRVVRKDVSARKAAAVPASGKSPANERKSHGLQDGIRPQGHQIVASEVLDKGWEGRGWAVGKAKLEADGVVRAVADGEAGFVTRKVPFEGGGAFEVEVQLIPGSKGVLSPKVSIVTDADEGVGCDVSLDRDTTTFRAFAPGRTRELKIRVLARNCKAGSSFAVRRITFKRIDVDTHQRAVRALVGEPVLASMASIPSRREMLADAVNSLLAQSDRVRVFLNNYPDVPDFLDHPRVEVRRSQDWDDRGDAGKVFWLEHDKEPGYRLIVDDDLIFPPDFAEVMCAKVAAKDRKAIYAMHGVLVRQPIKNYYDNGSRAATFHFGRELTLDRSVHIGATNALCLHSSAISMRWADFKYCNSADVWLALHAQEKGLEVLTPARSRNWVRENRHAVPDDTIYKHSVNRTRSRFDSSLVQDATFKRSWPLTVKVGGRLKCGLLATVGTRDALAARIERLIAGPAGGAASGAEWVVMLAYDSRIPASKAAVVGTRIERETHLLDIASGIDALTQAAALMARIGLDAFVAVDGDALAADGAGAPPVAGMPERWRDGTTIKLRLAGHKALAGVIVAGGEKVPDGLLRLLPDFAFVPAGGEAPYAKALGKRKLAVVTAKAIPATTINTVFNSVKVLNLDRRPDRWASVSKSLALAGIEAERFRAVDGNQPEVTAEYERYALQPKVTVSAQVPAVSYEHDLYLNYASQMARIAYVEREGKKAVASRGAWGYLKSYEAILEEALAQGRESLLVFDDDVLLHKDIKTLFAQAMKQLPDNWLILQLGTLQYTWSPPWCEWHSPMLYRTNGSAVGSHAVGMRFDVMPFLLDQVRRFDMPYDIGALAAATRAFPDRCFVIHPNLAIQSMTDTDIGTSEFQSVRKREEAAATYRWTLDDYR